MGPAAADRGPGAALAYRPDIDGLRAVAVLAVILHHAGAAGFQGGFVGVDVFFVISGYLITALVLRPMDTGSFSLRSFYARRALRLLPALLVMLAACLPWVWAWSTPAELRRFSLSLMGATSFSANLLFWQTTGYLGVSAENAPLLHTWSLSVEEQFYLLYPPLLLLIGRWRRRWLPWLLALACLAGLAWQVAGFGSAQRTQAAFFLLPGRSAELLAGAWLALRPGVLARHLPAAVAEAGSAAGLLMICVAVAALDLQDGHLAARLLLPLLGTLLVIGLSTPATWVGRLLGHRLLVAIGLISYSAYLWHQPLFALARQCCREAPGVLLMGALSLASLAIGALSWYGIERPCRRAGPASRGRLLALLLAGTLALFGVGLWGHLARGFEGRFTAAQRGLLAYEAAPYVERIYDQAYRRGSCFLKTAQDAQVLQQQHCLRSPAVGGTVVWGDSHAAALAAGLRTRLPDVVQLTGSGCPPLVGAEFAWRPNCRSANDWILGQLAGTAAQRVLLHAEWALYAQQSPAAHLLSSLQRVRQSLPTAQIVVVGSLPQWQPSLPVRLLRHGLTLDRPRDLPADRLQAWRQLDASLQAAALQAGAEFFSPLDRLCHEGRCQATICADGRVVPLAWDHAHLTEEGAAWMAGLLLGAPAPAEADARVACPR